MLNENTTLLVKRKTRDRLAQLGPMTETFDQLLNRLAGHYETCPFATTPQKARESAATEGKK